MKSPAHSLILLVGLVLVLASMSCQLGSRLVETGRTGPPSSTVVVPRSTPGSPAPEPQSGASTPALSTPPAEQAPPAQSTPSTSLGLPLVASGPCVQDVCVGEAYFLLGRPVAATARNTIDPSSRYGTYSRREVRRGVDFLNSTGTPVLAAAGGEVIVAGDDSHNIYGSRLNEYGNLVILKHTLPGVSQPVYTLYGHLSQVSVKPGDTVTAGQEIGLVGMSGSVRGSTLHFEVRYGENTYDAARNPELWLAPLPDENGQAQGALAGRVVDSKGNLLPLKNILIERLAGPGLPALDQTYLKTYADLRLGGQAPWTESFAAGDLPAGAYQVSFWLHGLQQREIEVQPGKLTFVTFHLQ